MWVRVLQTAFFFLTHQMQSASLLFFVDVCSIIKIQRLERMKRNLKKGLITGAGILVIVGALVFLANTASGQRLIKSVISDTTGGLDRTVTVYDYGGNKLKTYEGKIDVEENSNGNKVFFELDGKRVVIYNAVVISEEK